MQEYPEIPFPDHFSQKAWLDLLGAYSLRATSSRDLRFDPRSKEDLLR
jgi:hypothetical protein